MNTDEYLAEIRKWPRRPSDYSSQTEDIIRRILSPSTSLADISAAIERGQLEIAAQANQGTPESPDNSSGAKAAGDERIADYDSVADCWGSYELALKEARKG